MVTLQSQRIALSALGLDDVSPTYVAWLNDPAVNRYLETRHVPQTLDSVRQFVADTAARDDSHLFAIRLAADSRHIGNIKLGPVKANHSLADVSLFIGEKDCWGQGYATEAITLVSRFGFETLGLSKLSASFYADNQGSLRAFLKAGYREEGRRRGHYLLDGQPHDIIETGLCPGDLLKDSTA